MIRKNGVNYMALIGVTLFKKLKPIKLEVIMPEWLKDIELLCHTSKHKKEWMRPPKVKSNVADITSCYGMIETQKNSLTLKCWTDMDIELTPSSLNFTTVVEDQVRLQSHQEQAQRFCQEKGMTIFKINVPLFVRCKEDVQFAVCNSPFNFLDFQIPSGIVSFKYQQALNIFLYVPKNTSRNLFWNFDDALLTLYPLSDRKVKIKYIWDTELFNKYSSSQRWFFLKHRIYKMASKKIPVLFKK